MNSAISLVERLSVGLSITAKRVEALIASGPARYKVYEIPKRNSDESRTIAQPARELKPLQYWLLENILKNFPVHEAATGYVKMRGIKLNAERHASQPFLLKMDFVKFFPSFKAVDFVRYIIQKTPNVMTRQDAAKAARLLYWRPRGENELRLSIGAPTSPTLSNILMYEFDVAVQEACEDLAITYTRYADDLSFSSTDPEALRGIYAKVGEVVAQMASPKLMVNEGKTLFVSKKYQRRVTGLVLSNDGRVSLGRDRKRLLSSMVHHFVRGDMNVSDALRLHGLIAFSKDVEPEFYVRLEKKYGDQFFGDLKTVHRRERRSQER